MRVNSVLNDVMTNIELKRPDMLTLYKGGKFASNSQYPTILYAYSRY